MVIYIAHALVARGTEHGIFARTQERHHQSVLREATLPQFFSFTCLR